MAKEKEKEQPYYNNYGEMFEDVFSTMLLYVNTFLSNIENFPDIIGINDVGDETKEQAILAYYELPKPAYKELYLAEIKTPNKENGTPLFEQARKNVQSFLVVMNSVLSSDDYKNLSFAKILIESIDTSTNKGGTLIAGSLLEQLFSDVEKQIATKEPTIRPRDKALKNPRTVLTLNNAVSNFYDEDYKNALTAFNIMELEDSINDNTFDETGKLTTTTANINSILTLNQPILFTILRAITSTENPKGLDPARAETDTTISLYLPTILKEMGIDPRPYNHGKIDPSDYSKLRYEAMLKLILPFKNYIGKIEVNGKLKGYYQVLGFSSYDAESQTMVLNSPYIFKVLELYIKQKNIFIANNLFTPKINGRKSEAVELAAVITNGLLRQDYTIYNDKEKCFIYKAKVSSLIREVYELDKKIRDAKSRQEENNILKRTFSAAYKIIKEKTTIFDTFEGLEITEAIPTRTQKNIDLVIKYKYKK